MNTWLNALVWLLLATAAGVSVAAESRKTPTARKTLPDLPAFVQRLEALRRAADIPGLSVAVVRDQEVVLATGLGYADIERRVPATADTPYDAGSVAKPISAVVALKLAEEGELDLDRPMIEFSDWADFCVDFSQQPSIFAEGLRCDPPVHTLRHLLSHTATSEPGKRFSYNPVLYSWASRPMMSASGTTFSTLVERYVFAPANMQDSARRHRNLSLRKDLAMRLAPPHRIDRSGALERAPPLPAQGDGAAGGVITTVVDLARFDVALDQGMLISAHSRAAMMAATRSSDSDSEGEGEGEALPYGLGWFVQDYQGHRLVWHSGWWENAYSALYLKLPDQNLTFIVLANSEGIWWGNPLDRAEVERSEFARAFMEAFLGMQMDPPGL